MEVRNTALPLSGMLPENISITPYIVFKRRNHELSLRRIESDQNNAVDEWASADLQFRLKTSISALRGEFPIVQELQLLKGCDTEAACGFIVKHDTFSSDQTDIFLPGLWYRKNLWTPEHSPSFKVSPEWMFRADRMSIPGGGMFCNQTGLFIFQPEEMKPEKAGVNEAEKRSICGLGFNAGGLSPELTIRFPFAEEPHSFSQKGSIKSVTSQNPDYSWFVLGKNSKKTFRTCISSFENGSFGDFTASVWWHCFDSYVEKDAAEIIDSSGIQDVLSNFFKQSYMDDNKLAGFSCVEEETHSGSSDSGLTEIGFLGRQIMNAGFCLKYGIENRKTLFAQMGRRILSSWLNKGRQGSLFRERYDLKESRWLEENVYTLRRQFEAVSAFQWILNQDILEKDEKLAVSSCVSETIEILMKLQGSDGAFPRKFNSRNQIIDFNSGVTAMCIQSLLQYGTPQAAAQAVRAGDFVVDNIINPGIFKSACLDSESEDKESGIIAVNAMLALYEFSGEQKWLEAAEKAAGYTLTWFFLWDVPFSTNKEECESLFYKTQFKTSGFGAVSTENNHVDCYLFDWPENLRQLAEHTGNDKYKQAAQFITSSILGRIIPHEGRMLGLPREGFVPEVLQQTNWNYGYGKKGSYGKFQAVGWTVASTWYALLCRKSCP